MDFFDLPPEDRAAAYERAERDTGIPFFDLDPGERGRYYDAATEAAERYDRMREYEP